MAASAFWFMFDFINGNLITSQYCIPSDIKDTKNIVLSETPIPGLNFQPVMYGGGGNRKLTFTLPLINRDQRFGNVQVLKQFESLRNQATGSTKLFSGQFTPNPKVLYQWGTGSTPQVYFVKKCDFAHQSGWVNQSSFPTNTLIDIELWLDETNPLYYMEEVFRKASAISGAATSVTQFLARKKPI